ncbi:hypothetical protein EVAR_5631_1 [Eumeta japonica]|uniref:Uncharacterized protein n=1 Tax=Eumeta variegata TaxID=151549 RepID=A0A4C1T7B7_EUMVA|nr:hypothetical protein EVAR_5631_1 [Eumeta japonica]
MIRAVFIAVTSPNPDPDKGEGSKRLHFPRCLMEILYHCLSRRPGPPGAGRGPRRRRGIEPATLENLDFPFWLFTSHTSCRVNILCSTRVILRTPSNDPAID